MAIAYREDRTAGRFAGAIHYPFGSPLVTSKALGGKAKQVSTVTVDNAVDSTDYTVTVEGVALTVNSGAGSSVGSIAEQIKDAINAHASLGNLVVATRASGVVTVTSRNKGESFSISDADANLTTATTTTASTGDTLEFGCAAILDPSNPSECLTPDTTAVPAKVVHATPTAVNSTIYRLIVTILTGQRAGQSYSAPYTSDGDAAVKEIVEGLAAAINALLPAATVAVTEDDTKLILTSEVPGDDFAVTVEGGTWTISTSVEAGGRRFLGVAERDNKQPYDRNTTGDARFDAGDVVGIVEKGFVWVRFEGTTPTLGTSKVFVRTTAAGSEVYGAFRAADNDSGDCFEIPPSRARWAGASETGSDGNTIALLQLL